MCMNESLLQLPIGQCWRSLEINYSLVWCSVVTVALQGNQYFSASSPEGDIWLVGKVLGRPLSEASAGDGLQEIQSDGNSPMAVAQILK